MATQMTLDHYKESLFLALDEAFEKVTGMFLDKGTSLFETLDGISADVASRPVSEGCSSIAAQVAHTAYYLEVLTRYARADEEVGEVDWDASWETVAVTPEEWEALQVKLRETYQTLRAVMNEESTWKSEDAVAGSIAIVAHTAYHLGEIRCSLSIVGR